MASTTNPKSALLDGPGLRRLFEAAAAAVEARVDAINALNVFPVPDGDTGTNMSLTLRAALEDVMRSSSDSAGETAAAMARGALMGARGNSGVITSQLLRGFSRSVQAKARLSGADIAEAFQQASAQAYKVVTQPVEGTILTVIREVAAATRQSVGTKASVSDVLEAAERAASSAVARTPFLLPVLRENGVVDAGAEGLSVMLSGMSRHSRGEPPIVPAAPIVRAAAFAKGAGHADDGYGFCTEVLVERCTASPETLRERLAAMGQSLLVAADDNLTKVHIHTEKPDDLVAYLAGLGKVLQVKADDISKQHREASARRSPATTAEVGIVAVVAGESMARLYRSLGAIEIVPGGQTMNPSVQQLVEAIEQAAAKQVIVLPNNSNVVRTAKQAAEMCASKQALVTATHDMAQGIAALMAYNYERGAESNLASMERAVAEVRTGEVTEAVRDALIDGVKVRKGDYLALAGGKVAVAAKTLVSATLELLEHLKAGQDRAVTLYYGAAVAEPEAAKVVAAVAKRWPGIDAQAVAGGQPHYHFLAAVE